MIRKALSDAFLEREGWVCGGGAEACGGFVVDAGQKEGGADDKDSRSPLYLRSVL